MNNHSKYRALLEQFKGRASFSISEAMQAGIPRHALAYFTKRGEVERIYRGSYRLGLWESGDLVLEDLVVTASTIPNAVICLISALSYHELTDEIPRQYWIAIPKTQWVARRPYAHVIRMQDTSTGAIQVVIAGIKVTIFDAERSVVDAFRYLGEEVAIKALRAYLLERSKKPNIPKLLEYAQRLRVNLAPFLKAFSI